VEHPVTPFSIDRGSLHASLTDTAMESMNLLNQVAERYPKAISFAAGRPFEGFYELEQVHEYLRVFCEHLRTGQGLTDREIARMLYQYGPTKGIINDLIARYLAVDERITAEPRSIVVTVGAQEAIYLALRALRAEQRDAVVAPDPTYVGLTGAARLAEMPVLGVPVGEDGIDRDELVAVLRRARASGLRIRACYVTPDFANPAGLSMTLESRRQLLEIAEAEQLLLIEDNAYGAFRSSDRRLPTLKSLDRAGHVVYVGSFAKTGVPGARIGYLVADQEIAVDGVGGAALLADELAKIKSMLTVNTPPIAQAVIGGKLVSNGFSMVAANERERAAYTRNLQRALDGLRGRLGAIPGVSWNQPDGGFFVVVTVPFPVDDRLLEHAADHHGVLFTPMRHFHSTRAGDHQLRLSISTLTVDQIEQGLDRLAAVVREAVGAV